MPPELPSPLSSSAPWWLTAIYFLGVPAALCLYLVWFQTSVVVAGQTKTQTTLEQHMRDAQAQQQLIERQLHYLRATCLIVANGNKERERWCEVGR